MKLAFIRCRFAVLLMLACGSGAFAFQESGLGSSLANVDPDWLDSWRIECAKNTEILSSAYGLSEDQQKSLEIELDARMVQQVEYEAKFQAELSELSQKIEEAGVANQEDHPLVQQLSNRFVYFGDHMPLAAPQVASWLESRLPESQSIEGRQRFNELAERITLQQATASSDLEDTAGRKAGIAAEIREMRPDLDPGYNRPVPTSDLGERVEAMDRLNRVARRIEPTRGRPTNTEALPNNDVPQIVPPPVTQQIQPQPVVPADTKPETPALPGPPRPVVSNPGADVSRAAPQNAKPEPPPQPAPPLDDWEKYVLSTADKYGFNDAQLTNARSILSDLRRRAYQYQASRAEAFARVELMTDAKAREAEKKALNRPLDALFAELKVRLDSLPTQAQRQKAGPASPAKR